MPDYQIVRWDESNFDVSACDYPAEAYQSKNGPLPVTMLDLRFFMNRVVSTLIQM